MTLRGENNGSHCAVNIVYRSDVAFHCINVTNFIIEELTFVLYSSDNYPAAALEISFSTQIKIIFSAFKGLGNQDKNISKAVALISSNIEVFGCVFNRSTGFNGGAISGYRSNITLTGNAFVSNKAQHHGGAIFAVDSALTLGVIPAGNTFKHNSAQVEGGAIYCGVCTMIITGNTSTMNYTPDQTVSMLGIEAESTFSTTQL